MLIERPDRSAVIWRQLVGSVNNNRDYWCNAVALIGLLHNVYINKDNPYPECGGYMPLKCYQRYNALNGEVPEGVTIDDSYTIKEIQGTNLEGFERRKTLEEFIKKQVFDTCYSTKLTIKIFVDANHGKTLCVCNAKRWTVSTVIYNCLASFITIIAPWLFEENTIAPELLDICKDLVNSTNVVDVDKAIENFVKKYAKKPRVMSIFEVMAKKTFDSRKQSLENQVEDYNRRMASLMATYMQDLKELDKITEELANLRFEPGERSELDEYLDNCEGVEAKADDVNNNILVKTVGFMNVDPDAAEQVIRVGATWMTQMYGEMRDAYWSVERIKKFIKLLFVDHKALCKMQSGYVWTVDGNSARVAPGCEYWTLDDDCVWNPHHSRMRCMGSYGPMLADACRSGDNIRLMQTMQAAGTCMNILESVTVKHWAKDMFARIAPKCIKYNDEWFTPVEFMKKYDEETADGAQQSFL